MSRLLDAGSALDQLDSHGSGTTALIWAAKRGHDLCVRRLLQAKADPEVGDASGWGGLHGAARHSSNPNPNPNPALSLTQTLIQTLTLTLNLSSQWEVWACSVYRGTPLRRSQSRQHNLDLHPSYEIVIHALILSPDARRGGEQA